MTTIIAAKTNNGITIVGDGQVTADDIIDHNRMKIVKFHDYAMAFSGDARVAEIFEAKMPYGFPKIKLNEHWLIDLVIPLIDSIAEKYDLTDSWPDDASRKRWGFSVLLATKRRLVKIDSYKDFWEGDTLSLGSGSDYAIGYVAGACGNTASTVTAESLCNAVRFASTHDQFTNDNLQVVTI